MDSAIFRGGVDGFSYFLEGCRWFQLFLERVLMASAIFFPNVEGHNKNVEITFFRGGVDGFSYF
jgi:hypothetical protein